MTAVTPATYPDVFAGGAIVAGLPYHCATSLIQAFSCQNPGVDLAPQQWGDPGTGPDQCGTAAPNILDVNLCAATHITHFWGLSQRSSP